MYKVAALLLFAASVAHAADPVASAPQATIDKKAPPPLGPVPDGGVYLGYGGGGSPDAGAGFAITSLVIDRQLFWRLGAWISGETSLIVGAPAANGEAELAARLCIGLRLDAFRSESRKYRIITTLAFTHQHEATLSNWGDHFWGNLLGESKYGLGHRSGLEVGAGLVITPWIDSKNWFARRLRVLLRISAVYLPDSNGPNVYLSGLTSFGVAL